MSEHESLPGDQTGDHPVGAKADNTQLIIMTVIFAIIFAYASKWWKI